MPNLAAYCQTELAALDAAKLRRQLRGAAEGLVSFADNDYLGLARDARVIAAGQAALAEYGAGAMASRLVTGNHPLYAPLEAKLAAMKGTQAALVFGSGYLANLGIIPALVGAGDVVFADKLAHACMLDGAQLSGAKLMRFAHNDMAHLQALLTKHRGEFKHALIATEHVFSMDGDVAPLAEIAAMARTHDAWTLVDDAHGLGVVKPEAAEIDVWMGTLSKAAGAYGGYACAAQAVIDVLVNKARSMVFSTGLPPSVCASALAALEVMEVEPERGERALAHARCVTDSLGLPLAQSAIVPIIMGTPERALEASEFLRQRGLLVVAIRPPTVPPGTARLRLAFSSTHTGAQVEQLIAALKDLPA
ncbi:MAG: aminotransferase class I/II-fold pyridoxal phosphate-dependent enzyme [Rickettsiales bacterium]